MKKTIFTLVILAMLGSLVAEEPNLVLNPGFEEAFSTYATAWTGLTTGPSNEAALFYPNSSLKHAGARSFIIRNLKPNDSLLIQWVTVKPASFYRISAWVHCQEIQETSVGATICVAGIPQETPFVTNTGNEWKYIEAYGKTGPNQTIMPLALRLGSHLKMITGTAVFDDVSVNRVQSLPEGVVLYNFDGGGSLASVVPRAGLVPLSWIVPFLVILGLALIALAIWVFRAQLLDLVIRAMEGGLALADRHLLLKGRGEDRRVSVRIPSDIPVFLQRSLQGGGDRIMEFSCANLSREGFFVKADLLDDFKIGDSVNCLFKIADRRFDVGPAQVMRKQLDLSPSGKPEDLGMGLRFTSKSGIDHARLTLLLKTLGKDSLKAFSPTAREDSTKAPWYARLVNRVRNFFPKSPGAGGELPAQTAAALVSAPTAQEQTALSLPEKKPAGPKAPAASKRSRPAKAAGDASAAPKKKAATGTKSATGAPGAKSAAKKPTAAKKVASTGKSPSTARKAPSSGKKS